MKSFVIAIVAALALGLLAATLLNSNQRFAYQAFATSGTRVSEPGHNLVGPKWNGEAAHPGAKATRS